MTTQEERLRRALEALAGGAPPAPGNLGPVHDLVARRRRRRTWRRAGAAVAALVLLGVVAGVSGAGRAGHVVVNTGRTPETASPSPRPSPPTSPSPSPSRLASAPAGLPIGPAVVPKDPGALALGPNGNLFVVDSVLDQVLERLPDGTFHPVAGNGITGFRGDGGLALQAEVNQPEGIVFGPDGTLYIADTQNNRVRAVSPAGTITTVVGGALATNPCAAQIPTGTPALTADAEQPSDVAISPDGRLTVSLLCTNEIVRLSTAGTLIKVMGETRKRGAAGIGGPALNASPDGPQAIAYDRAGYLYISGLNDKSLLVVTPGGLDTAPLGTANFFPKADGGIVEAPDGSVVAVDLQQVVRLIPAGQSTILDFGALGASAVGGIQNFLPGSIAEAPDATIYTDTNSDYGIALTSAIVAVPPGGRPEILWRAAGG